MRLINADKLIFEGQRYNKSQMKAILEFVDAQPTVTENNWIPCSERFPKVTQQYGYDHGSEPVQVTFKSIFDGTPHTSDKSAVYTGEKWKWFNCTDDLSNMEDVICEITAWKPLPEPYNDLER